MDFEIQITRLSPKDEVANSATHYPGSTADPADALFNTAKEACKGRILEAERVPKSDKLIKMKVDIGLEQRTIVGGIGWGADGYVPGQPVRVPHARPKKQHPDGGNNLFVDGSARWIKFENMYFMNSWDVGAARLFGYQEDWGNLTPSQLNSMKPLPADSPHRFRFRSE